ncbi:MAG: GSU2403 family nucleotidyltransferase fold protein [Thermoanaerobaculales bacterium]
MTGPPPLMVEARRVLLDALDALVEHRDSLVLVGAQAVYLRTDEIALSFSASYTTDADLAIDPTTLAETPPLIEVMTAAGFKRTQPDRPGIWGKAIVVDGHDEIIPVDLIVPEALAGAGRRGARLAGHGKQAAGRAVGLEAAIVDRSPMTITSLDPTDTRAVTVNVAGPAALLVAKLHKIGERTAQAETRPDRVIAKDAADSYRLMLHLGAEAAAAQFECLLEHPVAGNPTRIALGYLEALFAAPAAAGVRLAVEGLSSDIPADRVEAVCIGFTQSVLNRLASQPGD